MNRRTFVSLAAAAPCAVALTQSAADFNGRWDITVPGEARSRAWWLEIREAESGSPKGGFIGAPGGGLSQITDGKIENGELTWSFNTWRRGTGQDAPRRRGVYRARLVNGRLEGTLIVEGDEPVKWFGVRAPKFARVDLKSLKPGKPIELFNGKDLSGWRSTRAGAEMKWVVEGGILRNQPPTTDIVTEQKFKDFRLQVEYRLAKGSNSGVGLRGRYEIQIIDDYGRPATVQGNGALYSRVAPSENASKPAGEWQTFDITLAGNRLNVVLNGKTIINDAEVEGLTAIATDPNEGEPGPIILQGDHGLVEFRKITLTPLS